MPPLRADFREGDEDSNFSVFRVRPFSEWPEPLHWIAFLEILTKPLIHWIASPLFTENPVFFTEKCFVASPSQKSALGPAFDLLWEPPRNLLLSYFSATLSFLGISGLVAPAGRHNLLAENKIRSRPSKPNQRKGQNEKFMNFAHFCEFWCFSLGKQARFTSRTFVPECPCEKFMNWPFFGLVCRGHSWQKHGLPKTRLVPPRHLKLHLKNCETTETHVH